MLWPEVSNKDYVIVFLNRMVRAFTKMETFLDIISVHVYIYIDQHVYISLCMQAPHFWDPTPDLPMVQSTHKHLVTGITMSSTTIHHDRSRGISIEKEPWNAIPKTIHKQFIFKEQKYSSPGGSYYRMSNYPPGNDHISPPSPHVWVDDFPNATRLVGYVRLCSLE